MPNNIALRSPQYKFLATTNATLSTTCEITIDGVLRYTIIKNNPSSASGTNVDISELARDYLNMILRTGGQSVVVDIRTRMKNFPALNGGGTQIGTTVDYNDVGFESYGTYVEGANPNIVDLANRDLPTWLIAANNLANPPGEIFEVFLPVGASMRLTGLKSDNNLHFALISGSATTIPAVTNQNPLMKVTRIDCTKYGTGIKIIFVNKYGIQQDLWFYLKNVDKLNRKNETFNSNTIVTQSNAAASYEINNAPRKVFNTIAQQSFTLSSGYYPEFATQYFEQLLMSEYVWMQQENIEKRGAFINVPVVVKTSSMTQKTSVNDRLIEYTIEFDLAADYINNIR